MARMRILTANEQETFDKPPLFDHRDRKRFFDFPKSLLVHCFIRFAGKAVRVWFWHPQS